MKKSIKTTFEVESEEVLYTDQKTTCVDREFLETLKNRAAATKRKRIRLCVHANPDDALHEMLIVHHRDTYVPPHAHLNKSESFHMIEGALDIITFNENGTPKNIIPLSTNADDYLYYRLSDATFHTVIPRSEWVIFHETTNGPFRREETLFATFAPDNNADIDIQKRYLAKLRLFIGQHYAQQ
ncbi:MAG: WbuC family cupin fold metalloprotein [Magnetococcales bacterium]|nr:WbuC family cupin fold metalloprotein [Magnetococcales bacterium]